MSATFIVAFQSLPRLTKVRIVIRIIRY